MFTTFFISERNKANYNVFDSPCNATMCTHSFQCKLTVHPRQKQSPPYFVEKLSPAKVDMRGENVSLFVKAVGKPMPNLTWLKVRFLNTCFFYDVYEGMIFTFSFLLPLAK